MRKLKDYNTVPSPEQIRSIVADCVTAAYGHLCYFIDMVREETGNAVLDSERDNSNVLKRIGKLQGLFRGKNLAKALCEILEMPASAVGACNSFHYNNVVMDVAMRQFGIALLVVHDDDKKSDAWPYQTQNYLDRFGSEAFLPLTFGLIHIHKDGSLSILRRRSPRDATNIKEAPCYEGYALDMETHIRTGGVNLITGLFDLSYTAFADYILTPKLAPGEMKRKLPKVRDYRDATYRDLAVLRRSWEKYQNFVQDQRRKRKEKRATGEHGHGTGTEARTAAGTGQSTSNDNEEQLEADVMKAENSLSSYRGKDDEEKKESREWFHETYDKIWPFKPEMEDLMGRHTTIEQSLKLLGKQIITKKQCMDFFDDSKRKEMIDKVDKEYKYLARTVHPDRFNQKVVNQGMKKRNDERFAAITMARKALTEWHDVAKDTERRKRAAKGKLALECLGKWDSVIYVPEDENEWDYEDFQQKKKGEESKFKR
jgi:hypothetical protein